MSDTKQTQNTETENSERPANESNEGLAIPNNQERVEVTAEDLPLHCPMPGQRLWDSHPKVYLPIEGSGQESCPYCGTLYVLTGPVSSSH